MSQRRLAFTRSHVLYSAATLLLAGGAVLRAAAPTPKKYVPVHPSATPKTTPKTAPKATPKPLDDKALFARDVLPVVNKFCGDCHVKKSKGGVALKGLITPEAVAKHAETWDLVLHNVQSGAMPPEDAPQMSKAQRDKLIAWLESALSKAQCAIPDPGRVTLRRLNRAEYNNTIRDLFRVDFEPGADFPNDDVGYGFDNIGDVLSISPLLMEKYLSAAEQISEKVIQVPPRKRTRYETDDLKGGGLQDGARFLSTTGEVFARHDFPQDGQYLLRFQAWAQQAGPDPARVTLKLDNTEIKTLDVPATADKPGVYEEKIQVKAGKRRLVVAFINDFYDEKLPEGQRDRNFALDFIEVIGPLDAQAPASEIQKQIIFREPAPGASPKEQDECAQEILTKLARRVWRRPVTPQELERLLRPVQMARKDNEPFERGIQLALQMMLVSPNFLFRAEVDAEPNNPKANRNLNDYELATRLSYFLWSSTPDEKLTWWSDKGALNKPENLVHNARRMLKDPRSRALADNFAAQWLQLRLLDQVSPDPQTFPEWSDELRAAMKAETLAFFQYVVREDRSVLELLDANYSFINEPLAKLYKVQNVTGPELRRVEFTGELAKQRGGLLTQASVLTLTSNPTRTSPVKRGKWVLEQVFNAPPPPPPPDVPDLPGEAVANGVSVRKRLEAHRKNPACSSCHARMDGIGFGLENYNAVGAWRTKDGAFALDTSGSLADGTKFNGPVQLKAILKARKERFARTLAEKLLTFALGRGLERADKCHVDTIVAQAQKENYKFSALITAIVTSEPFRKKRGDDAK
jgi:hypothetical protein